MSDPPTDPPRRLHIVGCHRSGTSLMLDLIATCFEVDGSESHEMSIYDEPDRPYPLFVSKQPTDSRIIRPILEADPNLYVIHMIRDPRAVISSIHRSAPDQYFCNLRLWLECDRAAEELAGHERFMTVRYEDLVDDPDGVQRALMQRFPFLKKRHEFSNYQQFSKASGEAREAMSGLRPISRDRVAAWQEHLPRIKAQMELHGGLIERLIHHGYEPDDAWTKMLDGIEPLHTPSNRPDRIPLLKQIDWKLRNWRKRRRKLRRLRQRA